MPTACEYLVQYGREGFLGRFAGRELPPCGRGDRVVVRSHRGLELGTVLCDATPEHARFLPPGPSCELVRPAAPDDEFLAGEHSDFNLGVFAEAQRLVEDLGVPIAVVDVEVLLEPRTLIVHYLRIGLGGVRALVPELSGRFAALVELHDLALGIATEYGDQAKDRRCGSGSEAQGCDRPDCKHGSCAEGGGCGSGSCGSAHTRQFGFDTEVYFAELGSKLAQASQSERFAQ